MKRSEDAKPSVFIFRPSEEQIASGTASAVCLVNSFYPREAAVSWKVDNVVYTKEVTTSQEEAGENSLYSKTSILSLTSEKFKSLENFACVVTHKTLSTPLITSFKNSECSV
uniref:Immunoglobulin kappa constant n=1 Tax=Leptobrachium leishanense TaxID=445787 RepID=A0A8C5MC64_9ANUR